MKLPSRLQHPFQTGAKAPASDSDVDGGHHSEKHPGFDESPIPYVTVQSISMGVLISMGGFIFGYDTGELLNV